MKKFLALLALLALPLTSFGAPYLISQGGTATSTFGSGGVLYSNGTTKPLRALATSTSKVLFVDSGGTLTWTATSSLGFDAPHSAVTLAGTPDYITIAGQVITRGLIDLATDITGVLPSDNVSTSTLNILHSNLLGLGFTSSGHTGTAFRLFGTNSAGTAAEYATSTLKVNHSDLAGLGFTSSGHTGTAFRLFGTNSAGSASEYATSTLKLLSSDILEGATNLFYTDTRVNTAISASTTVAHATPVNGNVLLGNGTNWTSVATTSLGFDAPHAPVTLAGQNYLTLSGQQITANQITLSGTHVTGVLPSANVSTSTLNINHSNLKGLAWTDSAHTGTAFNLAGFTSAGAATNYATSSLKITIGDVTGLGTGVATFLQTPSSSNLATAITDETGSGALVFGTQPVFSGDITTPRVNGSSAASGSLALTSTSDSSKGLIYFGTALSPVAIFDELNGRLALAVTTNTAKLYVKGSTGSGAIVDVASSTGTSVFKIANNGDITLNSDDSSRIGIGVAPDPDVGIYVSRSVSNNNSGARGIQFFPVLETTASGNSTIAIGGQFRPAAAVAQGTGFGSLLQYGAAQVQNTSSWGITTLNGNTIRVDELSGYSGAVTTLNILNMTAGLKGGTGTIGTVNVINIPAGHTVYNATNLRGLKSALAASSTAPTSTYNLYVDGTAPNYFAGYLGVGTSTPDAPLVVQGSTGISNAFVVASSTGSTPVMFRITNTAHAEYKGNAPTISTCGTSPSVVGNDNAFTVTTGTGAPTACTATFKAAWTNAPVCNVNLSSGTATITTLSTTAVTITFSAGLTSGKVYVSCRGYL